MGDEQRDLVGSDKSITDEETPDDIARRNFADYVRESELAGAILRRNRYNVITGEWYGPDPEPGKPDGPKHVRSRRVERPQARADSGD